MSPAAPSREVADQASSGQVHRGQEGGGVTRRRDEDRPAEQQPAFGQRGDGQAVPGGHHLVVTPGPDPGVARGQQHGPDAAQAVGVIRLGSPLQDRGTVLERPRFGDPEDARGKLAVP